MAKDESRSTEKPKAYPSGNAQGGRAILSVTGPMTMGDGTAGHRTIIRETSEGRAIARTRDHMPMVEVENKKFEYYEESGQLHTGSMGESNPERFDGGTWYIRQCPVEPWQGAVDHDGDQDKNASSAQPSKALKATPLSDALWRKKKCVYFVPPSVFTGRTRLWVQALYGTELDARWGFTHSTIGGPALQYNFEDRTFGISSTAASTTVIYFDGNDYSWWMLDVGTTVTVCRMVAADDEDALENLIDLYRAAVIATSPPTPADQLVRMESYILGLMLPDTKSSFTLTGTLPSVNPIAYGWKANRLGNKIAAVDVLSDPGAGMNDQKFISRLYEGTITRGPYVVGGTEKSRWALSCSVTEGPSNWVSLFGTSNLWVPYYGSEYQLIRFEDNSYANRFDFTGVPIYCFYDKDSVLQVIRYSYSSVASETDLTNTQPDLWSTPGSVAGEWHINGPELHGSLEQVIRSGVENVACVLGSGTGLSYKSWGGTEYKYRVDAEIPAFPGSIPAAIAAGGPWGWFGFPLEIEDGSVGRDIWLAANGILNSMTDVLATGVFETDSANVTTIAKTALVVPFDDCEAFYIQEYRRRLVTGGSSGSGTIMSPFFAAAIYYNRNPVPDGWTYTDMTEIAYRKTLVNTRSADTLTIKTPSDTVTVAAHCINSHGSQETLNFTYGQLVNPDRDTTFSGLICRTRTSYQGDHASTELPTTGAEVLQTFSGGA